MVRLETVDEIIMACGSHTIIGCKKRQEQEPPERKFLSAQYATSILVTL